MKARTRFTMRLLVVLAMLPLTCGVANAESLKGIMGQQAKTLVQQAQGDTSGFGTVDLTHPKQIPGQLVSNAKTAALTAQLQAEETALQDEQAAVAATEAQIAALQAQISQN
jgi:hypothetical protein